MLMLKNNKFMDASQYDSDHSYIDNAIPSVDDTVDLRLLNERDLQAKEDYVSSKNVQAQVAKKLDALKKHAKVIAAKQKRHLYSNQVHGEQILRTGFAAEVPISQNYFKDVWNFNPNSAPIGIATDYPQIVSSPYYAQGMGSNIQLGDFWSDLLDKGETALTQLTDKTIETGTSAAAQQIIQQLLPGQTPPPGATVIQAATSSVPGAYTMPSATTAAQSAQMKKYLTYGAIGVGGLLGLLIILKVTKVI